jgi:hypothetical protein
MFVRLKTIRKVSPEQYRLTLDVVDPGREHWDYGDCQVQADVWDEPCHRARARGILVPAFEIYRVSPSDPPDGLESKMLWDMGRAVNAFIDRLFAAGIVCPFRAETPEGAEERSE